MNGTTRYCDAEEIVVRALLSSFFDPSQGRFSTLAFKSKNVSLSRLSVKNQEDTCIFFFHQFHKPPKFFLGLGRLKVADVERIGLEIGLKVLITPSKNNPAHAELSCERLPPRLCKALLKVMEHYDCRDVLPLLP